MSGAFYPKRDCTYRQHAARIEKMLQEGLHDGKAWKPESQQRYADLEESELSLPTEIRAEQPRPALKEFRTALNALYLEVEPSIANDIVKLATAAIAEAESKPALPAPRQDGWISVKEKSPKKFQDVLIWRYGFEGPGEKTWFAVVASLEDDNGNWLDWSSQDISTSVVTHWQPLPPPPVLSEPEK